MGAHTIERCWDRQRFLPDDSARLPLLGLQSTREPIADVHRRRLLPPRPTGDLVEGVSEGDRCDQERRDLLRDVLAEHATTTLAGGRPDRRGATRRTPARSCTRT